MNGALKVLKKAELGEKVEYATDQHQRETAQIQVQLPNHYFVADEIKQHPNEEQRTVVIVRDDASKTADVVLPQGASLEVNNEIKGMNKQRFTNALQKEGYDNVRFYNPDGALGFRPDDSYFADKKITVSRLRNWSIEDLSSLDASEAVTHSRDIGFDNVQLVKDDKERWALYIKPEGKEGFAVYPDKGDLNHFFTTLKQSMDNIERVREELAQKYYAMAEAKPSSVWQYSVPNRANACVQPLLTARSCSREVSVRHNGNDCGWLLTGIPTSRTLPPRCLLMYCRKTTMSSKVHKRSRKKRRR